MNHNDNHINLMQLVWYFCDSLILFICGISLVNIHLFLSIVALTISTVYTTVKLVDFFSYKLKEKIKNKIDENDKDKTINRSI